MNEIESWQNGKWIRNSDLSVSAYDAHFFFGWAVFEAIRSYDKKLFLLDEHIARLYRSVQMAEIDFEMNPSEMKTHIHSVIEHNALFFDDDEEYRIMIFVSPGKFKIYSDMGEIVPTISISLSTVSRYASFVAPYIEKGFTGVIVSQRQIPSRFLDPKVKSCSRLHLGLADREAARYDDGACPILLDENDFIAESSGGNIVFFTERGMHIPRNDDVLRGCTLEYIKQIATTLSIEIMEGDWSVYDLVNSNCAMFMSTFYGVVPCFKIIFRGKEYFLDGNKKEMSAIVRSFDESVGIDTKTQWGKWGKTNNGIPLRA